MYVNKDRSKKNEPLFSVAIRFICQTDSKSHVLKILKMFHVKHFQIECLSFERLEICRQNTEISCKSIKTC